jgi:excisionase family DNA binding protein
MAAPNKGKSTSGLPALCIRAQEVAALLGIHRSTVWRWLEQDLIPRPRRIGGRTLWSRADVELFAQCSSMTEFRRLKARRAEG